MATKRSATFPLVSRQPPRVDFIDNRLPELHPGFKHPAAEYDPSLKKYAPVPQEPETMPASPGELIPTRPVLHRLEAMRFWSHIFPDAMTKLKCDFVAPKGRTHANYGIREMQDWDGVRRQLVKAKEVYEPTEEKPAEGNEKKPKRKNVFQRYFKSTYRQAADGSEQMKAITKIAGRIEYISPVLGVVDILLDAATTASKVRKEALNTFDPQVIEEHMGCIEFSFTTFPKDQNIKEKSVDLVVSILKAIEDGIGFFLSSSGSRTWEALTEGQDYQSGLIGSIQSIQRCSTRLNEEVQKSNIHSNRAAHEIVITKLDDILEMLFSSSDLAEAVKKAAEAAVAQTQMTNQIMKLLKVADEKELAEKRRQEERERRRQEEYERRLEEKKRNMEEMQRRMEEREREMEERERKREIREMEREEREKKQTELLGTFWDEFRKVNTPSPYVRQPSPGLPFQQHMVLGWGQPFNQFPPPYSAAVSGQDPQSSRPMVPQMQHIGPPPPQQYLEKKPSLSLAEVLGVLNIPEFEKKDLQYIQAKLSQIHRMSQRRSEAALASPEFKKWLTRPGSAELLVQGDEDAEGFEISGLTSLSATLIRALSTRERYVCLVFFCGCHIDEDDDHIGGKAMIKSFIAQLLRRHEFDLSSLDITLDQIRQGGTKDLCNLIIRLVHQIPSDMKVVCIIDEIGKYECDEHEHSMLMVLKTMLRLARNSKLGPAVKVLATSAESTDRVSDEFGDDDDCQLDLGVPDECDEYGELEAGTRLGGRDDGSSSGSDVDV